MEETLLIAAVSGVLFLGSCKKEKPYTPAFELTNSAYLATGVPLSVSSPAPDTWSGRVVVNNDFDETYYTITDWANKTLVFLDSKNGKLFLDGTTVLFEYDNLYWCIGVGYFYEGNFYSKPASHSYEVKYDSRTNTLDFTGTVDNNPAVVGLAGRDKRTGVVQSFSGDTFYSNAKLVLTALQ